jgi:hypothetical protein
MPRYATGAVRRNAVDSQQRVGHGRTGRKAHSDPWRRGLRVPRKDPKKGPKVSRRELRGQSLAIATAILQNPWEGLDIATEVYEDLLVYSSFPKGWENVCSTPFSGCWGNQSYFIEGDGSAVCSTVGACQFAGNQFMTPGSVGEPLPEWDAFYKVEKYGTGAATVGEPATAGRIRESWQKVIPSAEPWFPPQTVPLPGVNPNPFAPPASRPGYRPFKKPEPGSQPNHKNRPKRWPRPEKPGVLPNLPPDFPPVVVPGPSVSDQMVPPPAAWDVLPPPPGGSDAIVKPRPGTRPPAFPKPPKPGTKEQKATMRTTLGAAYVFFNGWFTVEEFMRNANNSLDDEFKLGRWQPDGSISNTYDYAMNVYEHFDKVNWEKALEVQINDMIEDYYYANFGQLGKHLNRSRGHSTGGDRFVNQLAETAGAEHVVPTLDIDFNDLSLTVDFGGYGSTTFSRYGVSTKK